MPLKSSLGRPNWVDAELLRVSIQPTIFPVSLMTAGNWCVPDTYLGQLDSSSFSSIVSKSSSKKSLGMFKIAEQKMEHV